MFRRPQLENKHRRQVKIMNSSIWKIRGSSLLESRELACSWVKADNSSENFSRNQLQGEGVKVSYLLTFWNLDSVPAFLSFHFSTWTVIFDIVLTEAEVRKYIMRYLPTCSPSGILHPLNKLQECVYPSSTRFCLTVNKMWGTPRRHVQLKF